MATTELLSTGNVSEWPVGFAAGNALAGIHDLQPINKILQRLLAGLIPIRALAVDYDVVELDGTEYIVHKDLNRQVRLSARPLEIVGVTEHEAYWKTSAVCWSPTLSSRSWPGSPDPDCTRHGRR